VQNHPKSCSFQEAMKIFSQIRLGGMLITPFFIVVQKTNEIIGPKPSKILFFSGSYDDILSN
jgi:hypothetical protein